MCPFKENCLYSHDMRLFVPPPQPNIPPPVYNNQQDPSAMAFGRLLQSNDQQQSHFTQMDPYSQIPLSLLQMGNFQQQLPPHMHPNLTGLQQPQHMMHPNLQQPQLTQQQFLQMQPQNEDYNPYLPLLLRSLQPPF